MIPTLSLRACLQIAAAVAFALLLAWALRLDHLRARHADNESRLLAAARTAIAAGKRIEAASKDIADDADESTARTVTLYRDRVLRLPTAAAACARQTDVPESLDGPGGNPIGDEVTVPRADMLICAVNTGRLVEAREWALRTEVLVNAGADEIEAAEAR